MKKIMFVCTGNICRSAMADFLFKNKLEKLGLQGKCKVLSAGTYAFDGDFSTYDAIKVMENEYGIDMTSHRATAIRNSKIEEMDLVLCMTNSHKYTLEMLYPDMVNKFFLLKDYVGKPGEISDPYGYGYEVYKECAKEISDCIEMLINKEFGGV